MYEMNMQEAEQVSGGWVVAAARFIFAVGSLMYETMNEAH